MVAEVYSPDAVEFAGVPWPAVTAVALYDPDSDDPHGLVSSPAGHPPGTRGPLALTGLREGRRWRVTIAEIEIVRTTPTGSEFVAYAAPFRTRLVVPEDRA